VTAIRPGVAAVVTDDSGRVLLHLRELGGRWAPPSGAVEPGESVSQALARELHEETGLAARPARLVGVYSDPAVQTVTDSRPQPVQYVTSVFACHARPEDVRPGDEGAAWGWFPIGALPETLAPYAEAWIADAHTRQFAVVR
jgi:ADP-ribose pyrophosphatase YjhB (NUDIX family)